MEDIASKKLQLIAEIIKINDPTLLNRIQSMLSEKQSDYTEMGEDATDNYGEPLQFKRKH